MFSTLFVRIHRFLHEFPFDGSRDVFSKCKNQQLNKRDQRTYLPGIDHSTWQGQFASVSSTDENDFQDFVFCTLLIFGPTCHDGITRMIGSPPTE